MIIHFGINPDSGGRPPIESRVTIIRLVMTGILFHVWDRDKVVGYLLLVICCWLLVVGY